MNVREYWTVLREDKWLVGSVLVVCVAIAAAVALFLPRTYTSTAIFYVASPQTTTSSSDSYQGAQLSTERVKSYSELLTGPRVAADASALLGGTPTPEQIQNSVSADSVAETVVLNLGVTRDTPQDAQLVGNAVATSFTRLVNSIESTGQPVNRPIVSTEVIFPPTLPSYPAGPGTTMLLAAGLLAGVVLGMGAALGRRALRRAVDTSDTLETALEAPVLAAMPGLPRRPDRPALLLEPAPGRRGRGAARARDRAAAVRRLRTAVLAGSDGRRCLVISGVRAEQGTTTVAVDLAVALALAGESVLLVDADLRRPALARRLGLAGDRGLATVLGGATAEGAVQRWTPGGLDVLPAGPALENPGEAWGTPAASTALGALRGAYTWVLLDASPVTSSSESVDLARLADGVVLVARRGSARPEDLDAAAAGLRTVGAPVLGSVFTFAVDVPPAPVEAPRALPPGRSSVEPAEAPAAPVDDAPTADVPAAADTAPAEAPAAEPVAAETEPTTADAAETPSGPATAAAVATAAGVTGAAAAASARRSRPVRRNDPDLAQNAAQKSISDGEAQPEEPAKPKRRASSRKAGEPTPAAAAASDAVEPATLTATAEATEVPAKPATRIRKPRVAKTASTSVSPTTPTTSEAPTATPDEAVTPEPAASAGPTAPAATPDAASTPVEKPARKPRAARRTATTTPVEPTPVVEPAAATEPVAEAPAETTTAGATTTPVAAATSNGTTPNGATPHDTAANGTTPNGAGANGSNRTPANGFTPNGTSDNGTTAGTTTNGSTPHGSAPQAPAESPATADGTATETPSSETPSSETPSSESTGAKPRARRATRTTTRASALADATTTVDGEEQAEKARARTARARATTPRTPTNGRGPDAVEAPSRPARTRASSRTTNPTGSPTSGS